ncbi:MAG: FtsX-like permease family protein [Verrucomicrobiales bacterium]|nr:FtsX-like permease family protein [Verrucomicrobiales bacterium]
MARNASLFLALRYLQPKRSFVSVITIISIVGVMLGVGVLVVVISVMKGFEIDFKKLVIGFEPHLLAERYAYPPALEETPEQDAVQESNWRDVLEAVKQNPEVTSAAPFAMGMVFAEFNGEPQPLEFLAIPEEGAEALVTKLSSHLVEDGVSKFDLSGPHIILPDRVATAIGANIGDTIDLRATSNLKELSALTREADEAQDEASKAKAFDQIRELILPQEATVVGLVRYETAGMRAYVPLYMGQEMLGLSSDDRVSGIGMELKDANLANEVKRQLEEQGAIPFDWYVDSWMDRHHSRLAAVQNERTMMYFVLFFVVVVAAFSVMNTTITVTVQKRREIGILTALGSRAKQIVGIFVAQAAVVAVLGTLLGLAGGGLVLKFRNEIRAGIATATGRDIFPSDIYFLSSIPAHVQPVDLVIICSVSIVLCLFAALLPAAAAAHVDPAVALRD